MRVFFLFLNAVFRLYYSEGQVGLGFRLRSRAGLAQKSDSSSSWGGGD